MEEEESQLESCLLIVAPNRLPAVRPSWPTEILKRREPSEEDETHVDANLNGSEDGDNDGAEPDDRLERRDQPESDDLTRRSDQVAHGVDDDGGETSVRNPCWW